MRHSKYLAFQQLRFSLEQGNSAINNVNQMGLGVKEALRSSSGGRSWSLLQSDCHYCEDTKMLFGVWHTQKFNRLQVLGNALNFLESIWCTCSVEFTFHSRQVLFFTQFFAQTYLWCLNVCILSFYSINVKRIHCLNFTTLNGLDIKGWLRNVSNLYVTCIPKHFA